MQNLIKKIKENLDERVVIEPHLTLDGISINIKNTYTFFDVKLLGKQTILIVPKHNISVDSYIKQRQLLHDIFKKDIVIYLKNANKYGIKRFIDNKIDFFGDNGQFYLPSMSLNIKTMLNKKAEDTKHEKFTPAMQMVFLYMLYNDKNMFGIEELSKKLGLTNMTLSRITREFEKIGLITHNVSGKTGRKNEYVIEDKKSFYNVGKEYLVNPVKKELYVKNVKTTNVYKNDFSDVSMLNDENIKTYAIYKEFQNKFESDIITKDEALYKGLFKIQLLMYDPKYLTKSKMTDPITMYLSIKNKDERVDKEFNKLMKGYKWFVE